MEFSQSVQHLVRVDEPLAPLTWLQIGGSARFYAEPSTVEELCYLMRDAHANSLPVRLIGDGSNVLVRDSGFDGLVINLCTAGLSKLEVRENRLVAGGGAKLNHVISKSVGAGLAGIEYLAGIPGTIGGAVVNNAGVKNGDLGCRVTRVLGVDKSGEAQDMSRDVMRFGFRQSNLDDVVVAEVELSLENTDTEDLIRRMQTAWIVKRAAQPPSGTRTVQAFIEPDGISISDALDSADMRGYAAGEVSLSSQFPGFLVVQSDASSDQVIALIETVTQAVHAKVGIQLQPQLRIW